MRPPPRPISAAELGAALARSLAAADALAVSASEVTSGDYTAVVEAARRRDLQARSHPPLPLPARAFFTAPEPLPQSAPITPAIDPLFSFDLPPLPEPETDPEPEPPVEAIKSEAPEEAAREADVFSEIEAEVSSRAVSPEELEGAASHDASAVPAAPQKPTLFGRIEPAKESLGQVIPQQRLEPQLWGPPPPPAFEGLTVDPSMRPDLAPAPKKQRAAKQETSKPKSSLPKRIFKIAVWLVAGWLALVLLLMVLYRYVNPPASALMLQHWITGRPVEQSWVPIENMSPNIVRAVMLSEDGRFCQHSGIDFEALEDAVEKAGGGKAARGASTISMQVVKNMFLWPSKSYLRKAIELPLTYVMEVVWPKHRIMEVYLNIAEWGPGIFGIGEAAEYYFHKPARNLTEREAARLAVALPNPLVRNAGKPGPGLQRLANAIQVRMRLAPSSQLACVLRKRRI
ncbi:monofunctional biosynthetic peptidoglycan transglycosylase [Hyphomicrobium sp.]|uniref:monofunctional biosynthetic peptidoglycan transglycosylase n=1 Tax=Hyphomicrobium sp. TaxID=82 RepID=UPI002D7927F4|nr:monofunctional biosynthetic peptidoglycan transglycosylase [Hyphomicrobium sp.]HET6389653.1 monofunctional biosynthetic peptidoglycan transglycosylase [Hyphomicrobium sp.]